MLDKEFKVMIVTIFIGEKKRRVEEMHSFVHSFIHLFRNILEYLPVPGSHGFLNLM